MSEVSYKLVEKRQKTYIKTYALLCLVLFLTMGFYSFNKWQEYSTLRTAVDVNKTFINALTDTVSDEKAIYDASKDSFNAVNEEIEERLSNIFPLGDSYTDLTRQIDSFEQQLNTKTDSFEVSNINYRDVIESENFAILPLRMSIKSSNDNFTKFLHLVENSGSLNDQVRLMDISSIRLSFIEESTDNEAGETTTEEIINFSVQINAYFQKNI